MKDIGKKERVVYGIYMTHFLSGMGEMEKHST